MKVLHLLPSNRFSGAENVACQIIEAFKNEIEMVYCCPNGTINDALREKGVKHLGLKKFSRKEVNKIIKEYQPDIIHAHDVKATILASKFANKYKVISHLHVNDKKRMGRLSIKSILYYLAVKKCKNVIYVSKSCLEEFYFKEKIRHKSKYVHNVININNVINKAALDKNNYNYDVVYLGRLSEQKNPLRFLEIMASVVNKNENIKCAIVGTGELESQCRQFVNDRNLGKNIFFLGFQSNPYKILQDSKLMLMSSFREGTPMAMLEAYAVGIPIVSTRVDGAIELITNKYMGALYNTNDEAISKILEIIKSDDKSVYKEKLMEFSIKYNDINNYKEEIKKVYLG